MYGKKRSRSQNFFSLAQHQIEIQDKYRPKKNNSRTAARATQIGFERNHMSRIQHFCKHLSEVYMCHQNKASTSNRKAIFSFVIFHLDRLGAFALKTIQQHILCRTKKVEIKQSLVTKTAHISCQPTMNFKINEGMGNK